MQSSDLQHDIDRLKKCVNAIEMEIVQLDAGQKGNYCSQIVQKEKEKFDMLVLIDAMEKKLAEIKANDIIQPVTDAQKKKKELFDRQNNSYSIVKSSYPDFIDN